MKLLTVQETADLLRVSPATVRRYIASGVLTARRVGRGVRVEEDAAERFARPFAIGHGTNGADASEDGAASAERKRRRKPRYLTFDDPIFELIGIATGPEEEPTSDVARNKYKYLVDEYARGLHGPVNE
jgi:excisionase family DNA binding protein